MDKYESFFRCRLEETGFLLDNLLANEGMDARYDISIRPISQGRPEYMRFFDKTVGIFVETSRDYVNEFGGMILIEGHRFFFDLVAEIQERSFEKKDITRFFRRSHETYRLREEGINAIKNWPHALDLKVLDVPLELARGSLLCRSGEEGRKYVIAKFPRKEKVVKTRLRKLQKMPDRTVEICQPEGNPLYMGPAIRYLMGRGVSQTVAKKALEKMQVNGSSLSVPMTHDHPEYPRFATNQLDEIFGLFDK